MLTHAAFCSSVCISFSIALLAAMTALSASSNAAEISCRSESASGSIFDFVQCDSCPVWIHGFQVLECGRIATGPVL